MDEIIADLLTIIRESGSLSEPALAKVLSRHNREAGGATRAFPKKRIAPYYLRAKEQRTPAWEALAITPDEEAALLAAVQMKPRRTASGVATITVITKPWPCSNACIYCPNDLRMPKSYMADEPACQRAERNFFDPYLQVVSRMRALHQMGHPTDKVELIVLGGTWTDYPQDYQIWYATELFRALNDVRYGQLEDVSEPDAVGENGEGVEGEEVVEGVEGEEDVSSEETSQPLEPSAPFAVLPLTQPQESPADLRAAALRKRYQQAGVASSREVLSSQIAPLQAEIAAGNLTYNQAFARFYATSDAWQQVSAWQTATFAQLEEQQRINETAAHRVVGFVVETRPDTITPENLTRIRRLGCTKVQMGIQSLHSNILSDNARAISLDAMTNAFALCRLYGFKLHTHFMLNLYGATPETDLADYATFTHDARFCPDEIKMYPCVLIGGTVLYRLWEEGKWQPYDDDALVDTLVACTEMTPAYTRISRMIRDFSAHDIVAGNKKTNLRQVVEDRLAAASASASASASTSTSTSASASTAASAAAPIQEMRFREISTEGADVSELTLDIVSYETFATHEYFLQWVTPENKIAGFLRLSLPRESYVREHESDVPQRVGDAMIREVHVYGMAAELGKTGAGAQHLGLGKALVEEACRIAAADGRTCIHVISSVGTREYYRHLHFEDNGLYQTRQL